jgi:SNF2 family DNA or RNA helicase
MASTATDVYLDHQVSGIEWLRSQRRGLLADEPGLGKSLQAIVAADGPSLVIAPSMIHEAGVWRDEINKWYGPVDDNWKLENYSKLGVRGKNGRVDRDFNGWPMVPARGDLLRYPWRSIILDEAHYVKGRKTWWTSCVQQIVRAHPGARVYMLTGTPIPNWAYEAFTLLQLLYPEESTPGRRFGSYWRWVREWFEVGSHWSQFDIGDILDDSEAGWERFRRENWGDRMLMRLRKDCLDLPPLTVQEMYVPMVPAQKRVYKGLKKDFFAWLDDGRTEKVEAWSSASQVVKLAMCATGLEVLGGGQGSGKLRVLEQLLRDRPRQTLVVAHFQKSVEECARAARRAGQTATVCHGGVPPSVRARAIRMFQRGEVQVLCASIGTVSEGLTLHQGGADQVIRVERSYLPSKNEQVIRRLHRMGVEVPVHVIDLITEGSVDEATLSLLANKTDQQARALGVQAIRPYV